MSMLIKTLTNFILFTVIVTVFAACGSEKCDPAPDVSEIEVNITFDRFDQDLFGMDTTNMEASVGALFEKYPEFAEFYFQVLGFKGDEAVDTTFYKNVSSFINFASIRNAFDTVEQVYGDVSDIELELSEAYKYMQHYLPQVEQPKLVAIFSELTNYMTITPFDNVYAVDFEYFFGIDYEPYYRLLNPVPRYIARTQNKDHLTAKILAGIIQGDIIPDSTMVTNSLLDYMILNGKRLYLLDKLLPCTPDSVKFGYSKEQTKFVIGNEFQMWKEVFSGKLYDTDYKSFQKYIGLSPNSPDMPMEAPGNTGTYIGFKIVEAFMERNPNYSMEQLIKTDDSKEILIKSRYKPKR